jgi:uncharacterized protein with GYD domain
MPKYLFEVSYTREGVEGVLAKGGSDRRDAVETAFGSLGGQLDGFYFAFGDRDAFVVADLPDNEAALTAAMTASASGGTVVKTTVLLTPEQVDDASKRAVEYRPPGG